MATASIDSKNNTNDYLQTASVNSLAASKSVSKSVSSLDIGSTASNAKTSSNAKTDSKDNFKQVLDLKSNSQADNSKKVSNSRDSVKDITSTKNKDDSKLQEIKDKLEELEEKSESGSKDDVNDILAELLALLNSMMNDNQNVQVTDENQANTNQSIIEMINQGEENSSSVLDQLLQLLQDDSAKDSLDSDTLSSVNKILDQLASKIDSKNSEMKNGINDLSSRVSEIMEAQDNDKVLTLEDMLSKSYSESDTDSSSMSKDDSSFSKEDKFLNSLLDDNNDSNQISVFANRIQTTTQATNETRGLTINKATFTSDVIKDVKYMATNSIKELTVKINPGNLGQITISLTQEDGVMKANLKANSKETTALLAQNLAEIKKELGNQELKISEVNIELYQDDTTFFSKDSFSRQLSQEQQESNNSNSSAGNVDANNIEEEVIENNAQIDNNLDYLA